MQNIGYFNGTIGNPEEMQIPFLDRSVFFGDSVYDAVMILDQKPFTLDLHLDRLYQNCRLIEIPFAMSREELKKEISRLLSLADMGSSMLYIQITRGDAPRRHEFPANAKPNLIMMIKPLPLPPWDKRASLHPVEDLRFQYCNIKTTNLLPNVFAAQKASAAGATEALLHRGDRVTEAAHSSILMLRNGHLVMPPLDELILPGVTRKILEKLCAENDIPVDIRIITIPELMDADEILLCSTTKNIIFVYDVDGIPVGGRDQALAKKLQDLFREEIFAETGVRL